MSESDQYVLIHHEFAGLAGIEVPNGDDSNYLVSNQISGFLANQVVARLVVKPVDLANKSTSNAPIGSWHKIAGIDVGHGASQPFWQKFTW